MYRTSPCFFSSGWRCRIFGGFARVADALVGALFSLPFILFSMAGGYLADRYSKRTISIGVKVFEILVMLLATAGLACSKDIVAGLCVLMGMHSAFFGPSKYGLLPELLPETRLSWATPARTGHVSGHYFRHHGRRLAFESFHGAHGQAGMILVGLAVAGTLTSLTITRVPAADPGKKFRLNFFADLSEQLSLIRRDRVLSLSVLGTPTFFLAALIQQYAIYAYGKDLLG